MKPWPGIRCVVRCQVEPFVRRYDVFSSWFGIPIMHYSCFWKISFAQDINMRLNREAALVGKNLVGQEYSIFGWRIGSGLAKCCMQLRNHYALSFHAPTGKHRKKWAEQPGQRKRMATLFWTDVLIGHANWHHYMLTMRPITMVMLWDQENPDVELAIVQLPNTFVPGGERISSFFSFIAAVYGSDSRTVLIIWYVRVRLFRSNRFNSWLLNLKLWLEQPWWNNSFRSSNL